MQAQYQDDNGMVVTLPEEQHKLDSLKRYIGTMMTEGVDYGTLPKSDKKCLFKSGAEKLCSVYGLAPTCELIGKTEDFSTGLFNYEIKVILVNKDTGMIEAEGAGCCNSYESKYEKANKYNIANTILKMAKKRAFVDAVLLATRSSDIFTQDLEDGVIPTPDKRETATPAKQETVQAKTDVPAASSKQVSFIFKLLSQQKIPMNQVREHLTAKYGKSECKDLSKAEASDYIDYLCNDSKAS